MANGWTLERRQRQAELIRNWQPWKQSTGPKTVEGKALVARNAYKGNVRAQLREIVRVLADQRRSLKAARQTLEVR